MTKAELTYGNVGGLKKALAEAARTDETNADRAVERFVELRPGMTESLVAARHHLLTGRRGTGKSTLLHVVRQRLRDEGVPVAVIDMEKFKARPYPDVLIEILVRILDELRPTIRLRHILGDWYLRRQFKKTRQDFSRLLSDPQSFVRQVSRTDTKRRHRGIRGQGRASSGGVTGSGVQLDVMASGGRDRSESISVTSEFEELKIERLQQEASRLSEELSQLVKESKAKRALVFIDDFYYVRLDEQPSVLDYLHQVCKGAGIWLKVGGVEARMRPYRDGDPPLGMQPTQDIDRLRIDVTLDDFGTAQRFLENMLEGILQPCGLTVGRLFSPTARSRMVLACGGAVARDYITLTDAALDAAVERTNKKTSSRDDSTTLQIQAEDVNRAARKRMNSKEEQELNQDAGSDAMRLKHRWRDVCDFMRERSDNTFILIAQKDLDDEPWAQEEIRQLEDLRLLHRIRATVPNSPNWRGIKTVVYMVDLGQVVDTRLTQAIPAFWKSTAEFERLRRAEWVYSPTWRSDGAATKTARSTSAILDPEQGNLFEQGA